MIQVVWDLQMRHHQTRHVSLTLVLFVERKYLLHWLTGLPEGACYLATKSEQSVGTVALGFLLDEMLNQAGCD